MSNYPHSNDFNWVKERAECNNVAVFDNLFQRVEEDVKQANEHHLATEENEFLFVPNPKESEKPSFVVKYASIRTKGIFDHVLFERYNTKIIIKRANDHSPLSVISKWNSSEQCCDYFVGGEPKKVWEISQMALESFFFRQS